MYLTFEEYQLFGGQLSLADFNLLEMDAETIIDWYTFNRLANDTDYPDAVKKCMYQLIDILTKKRQATAIGQNVVDGSTQAAIASQSNDGVSISYNVMNAQSAYDMLGKETDTIVKRYLSGIVNSLGQKLLYRGL